eukprot:1639806-Pleurochrysis_carterae.AAC.1
MSWSRSTVESCVCLERARSRSSCEAAASEHGLRRSSAVMAEATPRERRSHAPRSSTAISGGGGAALLPLAAVVSKPVAPRMLAAEPSPLPRPSSLDFSAHSPEHCDGGKRPSG